MPAVLRRGARPVSLVHMPKTGGTWASHVLERRGAELDWDHQPAFMLSPLDPHPRVGIGRDPWLWYLSLWRHLGRMQWPPAAHIWSRGKGTSFRECLYGWTHPDTVDVPTALLPGFLQVEGGRLGRFRFLHHKTGLWSYAISFWFGDLDTWGCPGPRFRWGVDRLLSTATLTEELGELLGEDLEQEREIKRNAAVSERGRDGSALPSWSRYYDAEAFRWVLEAEAWGLEALGMEAPGDPVRTPIGRG